MIISNTLNWLVDFFGTLFGNLNIDCDLSNNTVLDVLSYGVHFVGASTFYFVMGAFVSAFSITLLVGFIQWIWDRLPLT